MRRQVLVRAAAGAAALLALTAAPAAAVPPGPASGTPEWARREAANYAKTTEAPTEQATDPAFQQRLAARNASNLADFQARQQADPSWAGATTGNLCETWMEQCAGDPDRYPDSAGPDGAAFYATEAVVTPVVFYDRGCARISGRVWRPKAVAPGARLPNVVIETGSVQAPETLYWFLAQRYVRAGYAVLTFDVRGQGRSDNHAPGGAQGSNANPAVFWDGLVDAISFFRSTPSHPYAHDLPTSVPGGCGGTTPTVVAPSNPIADVLDPGRLGIVGHSLGATGVSTVQADDAPGQPTWLQAGGQADLDATNPVRVAVALDSLTTTAPRVPALNMSSEYGLTPVPFTSQPAAGGRDGGFAAYQAAGVPAMSVILRGSTHYEFSKIPTLPTTSWRYGGPVVEQLTTAWLDRWLKLPGEPGYDDADARLLDDTGKVYAGVKAGDPAESLCDRLSIYFSASRAFPTRSGAPAVTPDLQDACAAAVTPAVPEAPATPLLLAGAAAVMGLTMIRRRRRA